MGTEGERKAGWFIGRYPNKKDAKNRVFVPARHKAVLYARWGSKPDLMLAVTGPEPCVRLIAQDEWFAGKVDLRGLPLQDRRASKLRRMAGLAEECELDSLGRICLSAEVQRWTKVKDEVLFVGCEEYLEIWNPEVYYQHMQELQKVEDELLDGVRAEQAAREQAASVESEAVEA